MIFGCCVPLKAYELVCRCGYQSFCVSGAELAELNQEELEKAVELVQSGPLLCQDINAYCSPQIVLAGPEHDVARVEEYARHIMPRAQRMGIKHVGIGSPKSRNLPEEFDRALGMEQLVASFAVTCDVAAEYGIEVLVESVCDIECNHVTTTAEALALLEKIDRKNLGLVYDIYHTHQMGESLDWIAKAASYIRLVHIAQDQNRQRHYLREENQEEYKGYMDALRAASYDGCVSLEAFYGELEDELPRSLKILKSL